MKRLMKRWLAMVLVVLMVMGTLPTSAWAARIEDDATPATPVVDGKDGVVDTLAKSGKDDDVIPVNPVDPTPDDPPADFFWRDVTLDVTLNDGEWIVEAFKPGLSGATGSSGSWGIAIVPDVKKTTGNAVPSAAWDASGAGTGDFTPDTEYSSFTAFLSDLKRVTGLEDGMYFTQFNNAGLSFDQINGATVTGTMDSFSDLAVKIKDYYLADNKQVGENPASIPFTVFMWTQQNPNGLAFKGGLTYGGGIPDATYVIDLREDAETETPNGGRWELGDGDGRFYFDLENTLPDAVTVEFDQTIEGRDQTASFSENSANVVIGGFSTQEDIVAYISDATDGSVTTLEVPYYLRDEGEDAERRSFTITIIVIVDGFAIWADEIVFEIYAGDTDPVGPELVKTGATIPLAGSYGFESVAFEGDGLMYYDNNMTLEANAVGAAQDGDTLKIVHGDGRLTLTYTPDGTEEPDEYFLTGSVDCFEIKEDWGEDEEARYGIMNIPVRIIVKERESQTYDYSLEYDGNGNTGGSVPTMQTAKDTATSYPFTVKGNTGSLTKTGYTFLGWSEDENATTATYTGTGSETITATAAKPDLTLWAVWQINKFTITYTSTHGSKPSDVPDIPYGDKTQTAAAFPGLDSNSCITESGHTYRFDGWKEGDDTYAAGDGIEATGGITKNHTLVAQWTEIFTVTYDPNGGNWSGSTANQTFSGASGTTYTKPAKPTRDGYEFVSWQANETETTEETISKTVTYTAQWSEVFTVTYNPNGGNWSGSTANQTFSGTSGTTYTTPDDPMRSNYKFNGWSASVTGTTYDTITKNVTYTAQWVGQSSVTFDMSNGGTFVATGGAQNQTGNVDTAVTMPATPTRTGYTFAGWSIDQSDTSGATSGIKFPVAVGTTNTYYAIWSENGAPGVVKVKLDSGAYKGLANSITLKRGGADQTATFTESPDGTYTTTDGLGVGTYAVYINNEDTGKTLSISAGSCTPAEVRYWTVQALSGGNGTATLKIGGTDVGTSKNVLHGTKVTWEATPDDYYQFKNWTGTGTSTVTAQSHTVTSVEEATTYTANFQQLTSDVTVTVKLNGSIGGVNKAVEIMVNGKKITVAANATGTAAVATFKDLPQQEAGYDVTVTDAPSGWSTTKVYAPGVDGTNRPKNADVNFYGLTVAVTTDTAYNHGTVGILEGTTAPTAETTDKTLHLLAGEKASVGAFKDAKYAWSKWESSDATKLAAPTAESGTVTMPAAPITLTASFNKEEYDAQLTVTLNGGAASIGSGDIISVTCSGGTPDLAGPTGGVWKVTGLRTGTKYTWTVKTLSGDYTVDTDTGDTDPDVKSLPLYSVETAAKSSMEDNRATMTANGTANVSKVIVKVGTPITGLTVDPADGYTHTGWNVANAQNSETVNFANKTFSLTAAVDKSVILTPTFKYTAKVNPTRGGKTFDVDTVVVKTGSTTVGTATEKTDHTWEISGLTPGTDYDIWVNGYLSNKDTNGVAMVDVPIWAVTATDYPVGAAQTKTVDGKAVVYLPNGANDATGLDLVATAKSDYRARTASETVKPWAITDGTAGAVNATYDKVVIADIQADVEVTANFVKRWEITKAMSGNTGTSKVEFGDLPANGTTVNSNKVALDEDSKIAITATRDPEQQIKGWAITGGDGTLYSDATCTTAITASYTGDTVYAKAVNANATVTVTFETRTYEIIVQVNKNNEAYRGVKVKLNNTGTEEITDPNGQATFTVTKGTYTAWANGSDTTSNTLSDTSKSLEVSSTTNDGGTITLNYYTVAVDKRFSDGVGASDVYANHGKSASNSGEKTKTMLFTGSAQDIAATSNNQNGTDNYYRFDKWTSKATGDMAETEVVTFTTGKFTLPTETALVNNTKVTGNGITITANFKRQFKVTPARGYRTPSNTSPEVQKTGDSSWSSGAIYVDDGTSVTLNVGGTVPTGYYFKNWTAPDDTGSFGTPGGTNEDAVFTPTADVTLSLNMWLDAGFTGDWLYDKTTSVGTNGSSLARTFVWTANDADTPSAVHVKKQSETDWGNPISTSCYSLSGNTYTLTPEYLESLEEGTYDIRVTYDLGTAGPNSKTGLTKSAWFEIKATKYELTKTTIGVKGDTNATPTLTLNVDESARDTVEYWGHEHTGIKPHDKIVLKWYYADTAPNPGTITATEVSNRVTAGTWKELTGTEDFTGTATPYTTVPHYDSASNNTIKGKYVFAVATATITGTGTVVSNYIPVDYDAEITVNEDDVAVTAAGSYKVYLRDSNATGAFTTASAISTSFKSGKFVTEGSKLTGGKSYHVYVTTVEGGTDYQKVDGITITGAENTATVKYYTVYEFKTEKKHAPAPSGSGVSDLAETFTTTPGTKFVVKGGAADGKTVGNGTAVLSGTKITASADAAWNEDYKWNWGSAADNKNNGTNGAPASLTYGTQGQASGGTSADYTITETRWIGGEMQQRTYTVKGNVKDINNETKSRIVSATLTSADGKITFNHSKISNSGANGAIVEFEGVPRNVATGAVGANYTIAATPSSVAANATTIIGYSAPSADTFTTSNPEDVEVTPTATEDRFTIFVEETKKELTVADAQPGNTSHTVHTTFARGNGNNNDSIPTHEDKGTFANYAGTDQWKDKTVSVTNTGNTPLKVTLTITDGSGNDVYTGSEDTSGTLTINNAAGNKKVTFTNLGSGFTLDPGKSKEVDIGIAAGTLMNVADSDTYSFTFTTKDARPGYTDQSGPTVTYKYKMVINKVTVDSVSTQKTLDANGNITQYAVETTTIKEDAGKTGTPSYDALVTLDDTDYDATDNADILYEWYVAPWNAKVALNKTTGIPYYTSGGTGDLEKGAGTRGANNATYEPAAGEKGMALFLVALGTRNATSAAMTPDVEKNEPVALVPFDVTIMVKEDNIQVKNETNADGYTIYLWNTAGGANIDLSDTTNLIPTKWDGAGTVKGFKTTKDLWASDPANPDATKPYTYKVYASRVKGDPAATLQDTNLTISVANKNEDHVVNYYSLTLTETTYDNGKYAGKLVGSQFFTDTDGGTNITPTANVKVDATTNIPVLSGGLVLKGETIDLDEEAWGNDYTLTWTNATKQGTDPAGGGSAAKITNISAATKVDTKLTLRYYDVTGYVKGGGVLSEITLTETGGNIYTMRGSDDTATNTIHATSRTTEIAGGNAEVFSVPAGNYTIEGTTATDSTTITGYKVPENGTSTNIIVVAESVTFEIDVVGSGQQLQVADTHDNPDATTANYSDKAYHGNAGHKYTLEYNNYSTFKHAIQVTNTSTELTAGDGGQSIYKVTARTNTTNAGTITLDELNGNNAVGYEEMTGGDCADLEFEIHAGLDAGTYTYVVTYGFYPSADDTDPDHEATATFTLTVEVKKQPFKTVTTLPDTNGYKVGDYTVDVQDKTTGDDLKNDAQTGLNYGGTEDYLYQWVRADIGTTPVVTWTNGTLTVADSSGNDLKINTNGTNASYTPGTDDQGKALYLVIYATKDGNATGYAISKPITTNYTGLIRINVDETQKKGDAPDPGYKVQFIPSDGGDPVDTTWSNNGDDSGYTAPLDPKVDSYTVKVSRFAEDNDTTKLVDLKAADGTNVTITNAHRDDDAYYYTVTAKPYALKDYQTGTNATGETFDDTSKEFVMKVGEDTLKSPTPVLSGQTVDSTANGWGPRDYSLQWQSANTTTNVSNATSGDANITGATNNTYSKQITETTYIGGRLTQNTYTVTGYIKNPAPKSGGTVSWVKLVGGSQNRTYTTNTTKVTGIGDGNTISTGSDGIQGNNGDTVTFTVVKGTYDITAYEGTNSFISKVTIGPDDDVAKETDTNNPYTWEKRNTETLTPAVAADGRIFTIYVENLALSLNVKDNCKNEENKDAHTATSTATSDHQSTTHSAVYYFSGVDATVTTTGIPMTLTNNSNARLADITRTVYKLPAGTTPDCKASSTNLIPANVFSNDGVLTVSGTAPTTLEADASSTGGTLKVVSTAKDANDAVYVVKFTAVAYDTENEESGTLTVYYIFDLTIDPLPIKEVVAVESGGKLQLKDYDGTANSGLANIKVQYDKDGNTDAATRKNLDDGDFSFIWAKAATTVTDVDATKFELDAGGNIVVKGGVTGVEVLSSGTGYITQQFTPESTDQGMNFYLIAYRSGATSNASEFAVSGPVYAPVTVGIKAYQTDTTTEIPVSDTFNVVGTLGEGEQKEEQKAQNGSFTVAKAGTEITFEASQVNDADPAKATYYFVGWGDTTDNFSSTTDLTTTYTVTKYDTVIGYYDLLPSLRHLGTGGYNTEAEDVSKNRSFHYELNNGSGNIVIGIKPETGSSFVGDSTETKWLLAGNFDSIPDGGMGAAGDYVLKDTWIKSTLKLNGVAPSEYRITFYDTTKGATTDGINPSGKYEGYDRSLVLRLVAGEVNVTAQVKNEGSEEDPIYHGDVEAGDGGKHRPTSSSLTSGGSVVVVAYPDPGYVFDGWTVKYGSGTFDDDAEESTTFTPAEAGCVVEASFVPGTLSMEDQVAKVIYGYSAFEGTEPQMTATSTATGETFTYAFVAPGDLAAEGITDADATAAPGWLRLNNDGSFGFNSPVDTNVASSDSDPNTYTAVDNELVVYVKATADKTGKHIIKKVTIDVDRGELDINGAAFTVPADALGSQTVDLSKFTYTSVTDKVNTEVIGADNGAHTTKGTWKANPSKYVGNDREDPTEQGTYIFTFTYGPTDAEKWNYKPTEVTLSFHVDKPPQTIYIADEIANGSEVVAGTYEWPVEDGELTGKNGDVPVELDYTPITSRTDETITYLDTEPTYTVKIKGEGNLYRMSLTKAELVGFVYENDEEPTVEGTWTDGQELEFTLILAPRSEGLWKGIHTAEFEVTGYRELEPEEDESPITATYYLSIEVLPKPITSLDIEIENPEDETPKKVEGTLEGSDTPTDLTKPDTKHGVTPLKKIEIVPEIGPDDETVIKRTVEVEIDPNYIYSKDDPETPDVAEPEITETTKLNDKDKTNGNIDVERKPLPADPEKPDEPEDTDHIVFITQRIPALMFDDVKTDDGPTNPKTDPATTGPKKDDKRGDITITKDSTPTNRYEINLGAYGSSVYGIDVEMLANGLEGATLTPTPTDEENNKWNVGTLTDVKAEPAGDKYTWTLDLSTLNTAAPGTYNIKLHAKGYPYENSFSDDDAIKADYTITINIPNPPSPGSPSEPCPCKVFYHIGIHGTTLNPTVEDVSESSRPSKVPTVTPVDGYTFRGWSLTNPATLKNGEQPVLVDPKTVQTKGETMTFYAVIQRTPFHEHYVIGYPDGTFGPGDDINRASVATIIARAILPDFVEGVNYGNPGGYSDVSGHWAESAIAYCTKYGVFEGMPDGTFQPNRPISRQEFALVMARLDGVIKAGEMNVTDVDDIASWALDGVYTTYVRGWVNGYPDGSFKPLNNIRRDEAVKVFNAYLKRGVDADGLHDLHEYVYPDKNTGNDFDQYKTWPDVPANHWAYYEIIEAANDHAYEAEMDGSYTVPEKWTKCWINERWGLSTAGADAAMVSAGFQVWFH